MEYNIKYDALCEIIERRLRGEPVTEIAKRFGVSRQYIYNLFKTLPKSKEYRPGKSMLSIDEQTAIIREYIGYMPASLALHLSPQDQKNMMESTIRILAKTHNCTEDDILAAIYRMTTYHTPLELTPYYKNVYRWRAENSIGNKEIAGICKINVTRIQEILRGWRHMPLEVAERLKKASGLTIGQIFSDLLAIDSEMSEGSRHE